MVIKPDCSTLFLVSWFFCFYGDLPFFLKNTNKCNADHLDGEKEICYLLSLAEDGLHFRVQ